MKHQRGVSIVEGLVALVILSVGMLGIASLYVTSLKTNRTALFRTHAVNLVNDMLDSIRSNGNATTAYEFAGGTMPVDLPCADDGAGNCTREQLARADVQRWFAAVQEALPAGDGTIEFTPRSPAPDIYTVLVSWQEAGEDPDERFEYVASLEMLPVRP